MFTNICHMAVSIMIQSSEIWCHAVRCTGSRFEESAALQWNSSPNYRASHTVRLWSLKNIVSGAIMIKNNYLQLHRLSTINTMFLVITENNSKNLRITQSNREKHHILYVALTVSPENSLPSVSEKLQFVQTCAY
jgi:hypothetical protein